MAYKHVELDLRKRRFRSRKAYWLDVREGRIPWPKYKKPRLFAIKLDPEQAIIRQCRVASGVWLHDTAPTKCFGPVGGGAGCMTGVRGRGTGSMCHVGADVYDSVPS